MTRHTTIHLRGRAAHTLMPRVLMVFGRRRLRIQGLQYFDLDSMREAEIQIDLDCGDAARDEALRQLSRIVEVTRVWHETREIEAAPALDAA